MREYPGPIPCITFDTNCLNSKGRMPEMNKLDELAEQDLIGIHVSETLCNELPSGSGPMRSRAYRFIAAGGEELTPGEVEKWERLRSIIFPDKPKLSTREKRDVQHLFDHRKYVLSHWTFFVTNDHHFLDHKVELQNEGIQVGSRKECLEWLSDILPTVRKRIEQYKDRMARASEP